MRNQSQFYASFGYCQCLNPRTCSQSCRHCDHFMMTCCSLEDGRYFLAFWISKTDVRNHSNGDASTGTFVNSIGESMVSSGRKIDHSNRNCLKTESSGTDGEPSISQDKKCGGQINATSFEQSHCSDDNESQKSPTAQTVGSSSIGNPSSAGHTNAIDQQNNSQVLGNCEAKEKENEEKICKTVNVKRDATKRVFIDKAPPILAIHPKRFSQDGHGRLSKLNGHVNFRGTLDLLDLTWIPGSHSTLSLASYSRIPTMTFERHALLNLDSCLWCR